MDYLIEEELQTTLAKKRVRYIAVIIDYLIYLGIFITVSIYFGEKYETEDGATGWHVEGWPALLIFSSWFILLPVAEGLTQQTVGKMLLGIKVVKMDHSRASIGNCIVRHLFDFVDFFPGFGIVGLLVAKSNDKSQRVGDLVAKTIVVVDEKKIS